jgi:hypothetical protein
MARSAIEAGLGVPAGVGPVRLRLPLGPFRMHDIAAAAWARSPDAW